MDVTKILSDTAFGVRGRKSMKLSGDLSDWPESSAAGRGAYRSGQKKVPRSKRTSALKG
jgi:hypothetical protein